MNTTTMTSDPDQLVLSSAQQPVRRGRPGRASSIMGLAAAIGGVLCAGYVGVTIVPEQLDAGRFLVDTSVGYQATVYGALASMLVWGLLALAAIITGVVALVRREDHGRAVAGLVSGVLAPVLWTAAMTIPALVMASVLI